MVTNKTEQEQHLIFLFSISLQTKKPNRWTFEAELFEISWGRTVTICDGCALPLEPEFHTLLMWGP